MHKYNIYLYTLYTYTLKYGKHLLFYCLFRYTYHYNWNYVFSMFFVTTQWLLWRFNLPFLWFEWHGGCLWKWTGVHLTYLILHNLISVVVQSSLQTFQNWQPLRWNPIEKNNLIHIVGMLVIQIHVSWFGIVLPDLFHESLLNTT